MATERANTLNKDQLAHLLSVVDTRPDPLIGRVKVMLSFAAGLRSQEIVGLRWDKSLLNAVGEFKTHRILVSREGKRGVFKDRPILFVGSDIGKYGKERTIVMSPALVDSLRALKNFRDGLVLPTDEDEERLLMRMLATPYVVPPGRRRASGQLQARANATTVWFHRLYDLAGFTDCSSHSGRRSFITEAARAANLKGCSLVDVQMLAGHSSLDTTQSYIDVSERQADLVTSLWEG